MRLKILDEVARQWGLSLSAQQRGQLDQLLERLEAAGFPHTAISDRQEAEIKHVIDSLACLRLFSPPPHARILDLGSGGGFPGLVLKIAWPQTHVTLVDAVGKKVQHLQSISRALSLSGVDWVHARAEELGQHPQHREHYDAVVARAVAATPVLAELCLPLVRLGGVWLIMKGPDGPREVAAARPVIEQLGGRLEQEVMLELPLEQGIRYLWRVRKLSSTPPRYPRRPGVPQKRPLKLE